MTSRPPAPPLLRSVSLYLGTIFVLQVIRGIDSLTAWTSLEQQDALRPVLDELAVGGLSRDGAETVLRVLTIVMTGVAAMALVFLVHTARGDRASRVWLTVLTVLVATWASTGSFLDRILGFVALFCLIQLWTGPIRRYFAPEGSGLAQQAAGPTPAPVPPPAVTAPSEAPAVPPPAWEPPPGWAPPPPHGPQTWAPPGWTPPTPRPKMPTTVAVAGWLAVAGSALVGAVGGLYFVGLLALAGDYAVVAPEGGFVAATIDDAGYSIDSFFRAVMIGGGVAAVVSSVGLVAGIATLNRRAWGRIALIATSFVTFAIGLASVPYAGPFGLVFSIAAVVSLVMLYRPEAKAWFVRTKS